jgi:hypothetical protein
VVIMGIFDKLMFWKKGKDDLNDLGLGEDFGLDKDLTGLEGAGKQGLPGFGDKEHMEGMEKPLAAAPGAPKTEEPESYGGYGAAGYGGGYSAVPQQMPAASQGRDQIMIGKELELISAKLDSLKVTLDSMNMRIASLERIARGEYEKTW